MPRRRGFAPSCGTTRDDRQSQEDQVSNPRAGFQPRIRRRYLATHRQQARPWAVTTLYNSEQHSVNFSCTEMTDELQIQAISLPGKRKSFPMYFQRLARLSDGDGDI